VGHSVKQVVESCRKVTGHPIPSVVGDRRPGDPACLIADSSLAQRELNWTPKYVTIESIVETAWAWHKTHPNGYATR